jgi:hypothetical protein
MDIIWALGSTDQVTYHGGNRGHTSYNLIAGQAPPPTTPTTTTSTTTEDPGTDTETPPGEGEIPTGSPLIKITFSVVDDLITFTAVAKTTGYVG